MDHDINHTVSEKQKKELDSRSNSFHKDPSMGRQWNDIKVDLAIGVDDNNSFVKKMLK